MTSTTRTTKSLAAGAREAQRSRPREGFTTKGGGTHYGLGLALVRQIAQRHGGWVRVSNDGGAVFTALIPSPAS